MALARAEAPNSSSGLILSRSGEISSSPPRIEIPLRPEMVRIIGGGRGIDLRYDLPHLGLVPGLDGYRDYEVDVFERKVAEAAEKGEDCTYVGPLANDLILPNELFIGDPDRRDPEHPETVGEFAGLTRWDFFKLIGNELAEVVEVKTAREFREEYRDKRDKLPVLMDRVKYDFTARVKKVVGFIYVPHISIDPSNVRIRFISTIPQTGKTNFERPMTPHESIPPTPQIEEALLRIEQIREAARLENKRRKAEEARQAAEAARLESGGVLVQFPRTTAA